MMKRTFLALALFVLPAASPAQDIEPIFASMVRITATRGDATVRGSGFVVDLRRDVATIVTASHVIEGAQIEVVFSSSTRRFQPDVLLGMESGAPNGLATFQVRGVPVGTAALSLDAANRPRAAEALLLVGFPQMSPTPLAKQRVLSGRRGTLLLIDLPVGEGFSGGPVVREGKVVGVVTGQDRQLTYAVNAVVAREALLGWGVALGSARAPRPPESPPPPTVEVCRSGKEIEDNGIVFVRICPGEFMMGSSDDDSQADDDEKPAHKVTLSEYWIGKYEVTNEQFRRFRRDHSDDNLPAVSVSWTEAKEFCESLGFGLPTEAQWEYAARAGKPTRWSFGNDEGVLGDYAWYGENSGSKTHPVGEKKPNAWGLHDMHGNVWEWIADWYGPYSASSQTDPAGPSDPAPSAFRVLRGGSAWNEPRLLRSACRGRHFPEVRIEFIGFRCVRGPRRQP